MFAGGKNCHLTERVDRPKAAIPVESDLTTATQRSLWQKNPEDRQNLSNAE
jgi:hypothetical protein